MVILRNWWVALAILLVVVVASVSTMPAPAHGEDLQMALKTLRELDRYYAQVARPRFGKRKDINVDFPSSDYDFQSVARVCAALGSRETIRHPSRISSPAVSFMGSRASEAHGLGSDVFNLPLPALWTAVLGDWDREREEHSEERIPVEEIAMHERFHNYQHDIALMKLSRPVKLNGQSRIRAVCLPSQRLSYNQTELCVATGWGRDSEDGPLAGKLLEARVPVHDNAICRKKYGHAVQIRSGHLCAGHLDGSSGTCVGDSGGPLQCAQRDGVDGTWKWTLAGITSFGSGCAKPGFPDVYTRLSYYMPWIKSKILTT